MGQGIYRVVTKVLNNDVISGMTFRLMTRVIANQKALRLAHDKTKTEMISVSLCQMNTNTNREAIVSK